MMPLNPPRRLPRGGHWALDDPGPNSRPPPQGAALMTDVVIVSAARTPVGSFNGALSSLPAHELGKVAIQAALERAGVPAADVGEVIMGQVLQAGAGQGPARQAAINAGLPNETPAWSLNQLCGSGLRAVALAAQQIADGAGIVI